MKGMKTFILFTGIFAILACKKGQPPQDQVAPFVDQTLHTLNQAIAADPKNDSLYKERGLYLMQTESYDSAIIDFSQALDIDSIKKPLYYHYLADAYLMSAQSRLANGTMDRALSHFPNHIPTILKAAEIKLILKQYLQALTTLDQVFMRDPQNAEGYYLAGHVFYEMKDTGRAINSYQKAVDINPEMRKAWVQLGDVLLEMRNPRAINYLDNAIRLDTTDAELYHKKAFGLQLFGNRAEAKNLYKTICIRFPSYEPAFYNLGVLYFEEDSVELALNHFDISAQIEPTEPSTYYQRARCYLKLGQKDKARADLENAIQLNSEFKEAQEALSKLKGSKG